MGLGETPSSTYGYHLSFLFVNRQVKWAKSSNSIYYFPLSKMQLKMSPTFY